jgi:hypothetical protein
MTPALGTPTYRYRDGHELRVILNPTKREVARIGGEGEIHLALVVEPLVFTLVAWFEGVIPWSGAPYSWHSLPEVERVMPEPLAGGEAVELTVVLVEESDGIVRAVRSVTLSPEFSLALHTASVPRRRARSTRGSTTVRPPCSTSSGGLGSW